MWLRWCFGRCLISGHRDLACRPSNFARNSPPMTLSKFEFRSLELQRFQMFLKLHPIELRAIFAECWPCRPRAPRPGPATAHRHHGSSLRRPPHQWGLVAVRRVVSPSGLPPRPATATCPVGTAISHVIPPMTLSNFEFRSLELQRFQMLLKLHPIELRASFAECWPCCPRAPRPGRACGTKFSLLGLLVARAVQSSPCWRQMPQNRRFSVYWESFVPVRPARAANRESFVPGRRIRCAGPVS